MHYLQDVEKNVIFDALAYYSTHAIKNTPPDERKSLYTTIKVILNKVNDIAEVVGLEGTSQEEASDQIPAQEKAPAKPAKLSYKAEQDCTAKDNDNDPPLPPRPENVNPQQWEKLVSMGLNDLQEWPFTDWSPQ